MEIKSQLTNRSGQIFNLVYRDADIIAELGNRKVLAVHGYRALNNQRNQGGWREG